MPDSDFQHCLTPEDFTLILNLLPAVCRRGGFHIKEYGEILPLYERMLVTARKYPDVFHFEDKEEDSEGDESFGSNDGDPHDSEEDDREHEEHTVPSSDDGEEEQEQEEEEEKSDDSDMEVAQDEEIEQLKAEIERLRGKARK